MILKVLSLGAIALLLLLRVSRTPFGAKLLGLPLRALNIVYLAALGVAGVLAIPFEQWILLGVVVALLVLSLVEEQRRRRSRAAARSEGRSPHAR